MDPNSSKKNMFNKLGKEQCLKLLAQEDFKRKTVSFYRYVIINSASELRDELYESWKNYRNNAIALAPHNDLGFLEARNRRQL